MSKKSQRVLAILSLGFYCSIYAAASNVTDWQACLSSTTFDCALDAGTWVVAQNCTGIQNCIVGPITIPRSNVWAHGVINNRAAAVIQRVSGYTGDLMLIGNAPQTVSGITIQDLTVDRLNSVITRQVCCGSSTCHCNLRDINVQMVQSSSPPNWAVTIRGVDFRNAAGHALSLHPTVLTNPVNDVWVYQNGFYNSSTTGIHADNGNYTWNTCDQPDQPAVLPNNIRIEENAFQDNQTGALGLHASNLTIINNQFAHNYINPDDAAGGTIFVGQCSDPVTISGNTLRGPDDKCPGGVCSVNTFGLELFGRNTIVTGNTIYNYPHEGIEANSVYKLTINGNNIVHDNSVGTFADADDPAGIQLWNRLGYRPTSDVTIQSTTSNNQGTNRQSYGVKLLKCPDTNCTNNTMTNITITSDTLAPNRLGSYCAVNGVTLINPNIAYGDACP